MWTCSWIQADLPDAIAKQGRRRQEGLSRFGRDTATPTVTVSKYKRLECRGGKQPTLPFVLLYGYKRTGHGTLGSAVSPGRILFTPQARVCLFLTARPSRSLLKAQTRLTRFDF